MNPSALACEPAPASPGTSYAGADHLQHGLRRRSVRSVMWALLVQPLQFVTAIGTVMVLARVLEPADFGLVAMLIPMQALGAALTNAGLETALVHEPRLRDEHLTPVFWFSNAINLAVLGLLLLVSMALAWFYGEPRVVLIGAVLAVGITGFAFSSLHHALLKRQMRFGVLSVIQSASVVIPALAALGLALGGAGYWALVAQLVLMDLVRIVGGWAACRWRPGRPRRAESHDGVNRAMLRYGLHITGVRVIDRMGESIDRLMVGYVGGDAALGLYTNARRWSRFPFDQVYYPIFDVVVSSFSRVQGDPERYRRYVRRGLLPMFATTMPAMVYLLTEARRVILVLLGDQWEAAVTLFQLLIVAVMLRSLSKITKWLYMSQGRTARQLRWSVMRAPVMVLGVLLGAWWGQAHGQPASGVAWGYLISVVLLTVPTVGVCLHGSPVRVGDLMAAAGRPVVAATTAGLLLVFLRDQWPSIAAWLHLLITAAVFTVAYVLVWLAIPGGWRTMRDTAFFFREAITKRRDTKGGTDEI